MYYIVGIRHNIRSVMFLYSIVAESFELKNGSWARLKILFRLFYSKFNNFVTYKMNYDGVITIIVLLFSYIIVS